MLTWFSSQFLLTTVFQGSCLGVALLSHPYDATKAEQKEKEKKEKIEEARRLMHTANSTPPGIPSSAGRRGDAPIGARAR